MVNVKFCNQQRCSETLQPRSLNVWWKEGLVLCHVSFPSFMCCSEPGYRLNSILMVPVPHPCREEQILQTSNFRKNLEKDLATCCGDWCNLDNAAATQLFIQLLLLASCNFFFFLLYFNMVIIYSNIHYGCLNSCYVILNYLYISKTFRWNKQM